MLNISRLALSLASVLALSTHTAFAATTESAASVSPVDIKNVSVIDESLLTFVCVNFTNNGSSNATAVRVHVTTYNAFHEQNEDTIVNLSGNTKPGASTHVPTNDREMGPYLLSIASSSPCAEFRPTSKITSAKAFVTKAGFADGTVWSGKGLVVSSDGSSDSAAPENDKH